MLIDMCRFIPEEEELLTEAEELEEEVAEGEDGSTITRRELAGTPTPSPTAA